MAPNIYYLGAANVVGLGPLRIAGLSGIWKGYSYNKPHYERLPYDQDDVKSVYHVRELDVRKLLNIQSQVDVGLSHDWPRGVEWLGDWKTLFAKKDLFEADARSNTLGSAAAKYVLDRLRPPYWFSAHLHCKYSSVIDHLTEENGVAMRVTHNARGVQSTMTKSTNTEEIDLDLDDFDTGPAPECPSSQQTKDHSWSQSNTDHSSDLVNAGISEVFVGGRSDAVNADGSGVSADVRALLPVSFAPKSHRATPTSLPCPQAIVNRSTKFLALDKCLPNRKFLQVLEINPVSETSASSSTPYRLSYDKEWLAITRTFASELILGDRRSSTPHNRGEAVYRPLIAAEEQWVEEHLVACNKMIIPENFSISAPTFNPTDDTGTREQPKEYTNPQTSAFCELLQIPNPFDISEEERTRRQADFQSREAASRGTLGGHRGKPWSGRNGARGGRGRGRARLFR